MSGHLPPEGDDSRHGAYSTPGQRSIVFHEDLPFLGAGQRMNVAAWLQSLGLERYEPLFRENEIDWEVLPKLRSEDLKEIGVVPIGHRRRLLDAIAGLRTGPRRRSSLPQLRCPSALGPKAQLWSRALSVDSSL